MQKDNKIRMLETKLGIQSEQPQQLKPAPKQSTGVQKQIRGATEPVVVQKQAVNSIKKHPVKFAGDQPEEPEVLKPEVKPA